MTAVVGEVINGLIGHQVAIVEEEVIKTQTVGQLQVACSLPLVLEIKAHLTILYARGRILLTVVAIGKCHNLRSTSIEEVVESLVTVISCTVAHIRVVSHLVLEAHAAEQFVVAEIPCHVILGVPHAIVHGVVVCEELFTERNVVGAVAVEDVDERELRRIGAAHVVELRVSDEELVAQVVSETAVEVKRERVDVVVHGIHGIGIRHCHLRCTSVSRTRAAVH